MNTIIISSVGTGKTRGFLKSNLLQKGCSFVITDTKGDLFNEFAGYLKDPIGEEYEIKLLNLKNPQWSNHYNPFQYMHTDEDVVSFAYSLSANTNQSDHDKFWANSAANLIASMTFFVFETHNPNDWNIKSLIDVFDKFIKARSGGHANENRYKEIVEFLPDDSMAKNFFMKCECDKSPATWDSIVVSVGQALTVLAYPKIMELTKYDDLNLELIGTKRMALFINLDDTNPCYDFIAGLLYTQIFNVLYKQADKNKDYRLDEHVRFFMDDFANYKIPNISHILSTCRSRGISIQMLLQSESQLRHLYADEANNLIANSTYVYVGSNDDETQENVAKRLGVSIKNVQNSVDTTYVFFPEGTTIKDKKANYVKHPLYKILRYSLRMDESCFDNGCEVGCDFWTEEYVNAHIHNAWIKNADGNVRDLDYITIEQRDDCFDSDEEKLFYNTLLENDAFQKSGLTCEVHRDLRDIFNIETIIHKNIKYKLMLMHCDFIFKKDGNIVAGLEIDGIQHDLDLKQHENDEFKNKVFRKAKLPLLRVPAHKIREECEQACCDVVEDILNGDRLSCFDSDEQFSSDEKVPMDLLDDLLDGIFD